ncbi:MAG: hypothetical protein V1744_01790 [Candidatus Altiarchaeota archaeon]
MMGVVGQVRNSIESVKDWIIKDLIRLQKPELDKKIDEMLKAPKIMVKHLHVGAGVGKKLGFAGKGLSLMRKLL